MRERLTFIADMLVLLDDPRPVRQLGGYPRVAARQPEGPGGSGFAALQS